ncbi:MAG TPA: glycosyl hydrolase family 28-related protein [Verrucomicrobiae bacterium]
MRKKFLRCVLFLAVVGLMSLEAFGQVPSVIFYQGSITASGSPFNGLGLFKFALVNSNGTASFWSNDGVSSSGSQPISTVTNTVNQGLFTILLGDTSISNMTSIPPSVFTNSDVRLRIWFGGNSGDFTLLAPDQRITSVGYAMVAAGVPDGTITSSKLASGAVLAQNIAGGSITSAQLANGAVTGAAIAVGSISLSQLDFQLGYINAKNPPYGAMGNGANDDTVAIQTALNDATAAGGGVVFLPRGNYYIAGNLTIPQHTSLVGIWRAPQANSQDVGTTLLAIQGAGSASGTPFITLQGPNSTLDGVTIFYPKQVTANPPTPYPWTLAAGGGENVTVQNVLLVNPYQGIDLATHTSARHLIRGVYGQPLLTGIAVDQCYDIGRIMDIHFWPFWSQNTNIEAFQSANAVTFDFMRTDWEVVEDVFSWGYNIGARFRSSSNGAMNGQMSNVNFDNVDIGLQMINTQPYAVHISNLNIANAGGGTNHIGIQGVSGGTSQLNVNGASFWGSLRQGVSWKNSGLLSLSNARFLQWDSSLPCVSIASGRAILQGNFFNDNTGVAIQVLSSVYRVMVLGNMLAGNTVSLAGAGTYSANNQP